MRFTEARVAGFGKLIGRSFSFSEGFNLIYGHNEAGKSTLYAFLYTLLYGISTKPKDNIREVYRPWKKGVPYGGRLGISFLGKEYIIERFFGDTQEEDTFSVIDLSLQSEEGSEGDIIEDGEGFLKKALSNITRDAYLNTVSIGQLKSITNREMVRELRQYIGNIESSNDPGLNGKRAVQFLEEKIATLEKQLLPEAAKEYASLTGELRNIEREIADPKYENFLPLFLQRRDETGREMGRIRQEKDGILPEMERDREAIRRSGFFDEAQMKAGVSEMESLYEKSKQLNEENKKLKGMAIPAAFVTLGFITLVLALFFLIGDLPLPFSNIWPRLFLCTLFLLLSFGAFSYMVFRALKRNKAKRDLLFIESEIRRKAAPLVDLSDINDNINNIEEVSGNIFTKYKKSMEDMHIVLKRHQSNMEKLDRLSEDISRLSKEESSFNEKISLQKETQEELEEKLKHLSNVKNRLNMLRNSLSENERIEKEIEALSLAIETLGQIQESIHSSFGTYLNKTAGEMVSRITGGAYDSVWIDDGLKLSLNISGNMVPLERISTGTIDQVYLALRLASAGFLQHGAEEPLPIILDESFAMYDEGRIGNTLKFLQDEVKGQLLLFTCHFWEEDILEREGMDYRLICL